MERILVDFAPAGRLPALGRVFSLWRHRLDSRRHLATLDARALADVGLTDAERRMECEKWFWQA